LVPQFIEAVGMALPHFRTFLGLDLRGSATKTGDGGRDPDLPVSDETKADEEQCLRRLLFIC
jgi:hypothetical protein